MSTEQTNGTDAKPQTLLNQIRAAYKANGGKDPDKATQKALTDAWKEANKDVARAEAELEAARVRNFAACKALATAFGGRSLEIGGVLYDVATRGETVHFRKNASGEVVKLG